VQTNFTLSHARLAVMSSRICAPSMADRAWPYQTRHWILYRSTIVQLPPPLLNLKMHSAQRRRSEMWPRQKPLRYLHESTNPDRSICRVRCGKSFSYRSKTSGCMFPFGRIESLIKAAQPKAALIAARFEMGGIISCGHAARKVEQAQRNGISLIESWNVGFAIAVIHFRLQSMGPI